VLLMYAEAINEYAGAPDDQAKEAIREIRKRAGVKTDESLLGDYRSFRDLVRNERGRELAFEGHRFWDIRRWKIGAETTKVYGLTITPQNDGSFSYVRSVIQQRGWDDRMNYYPIADAELFKNHNLVQNDGWK
jgi:hypothetical protein